MNIYHITARAAWTAAREHGAFEPPGLESEGFVHCSTARQVLSVAGRFYAGQTGLALLVIDPARLTSPLKWEHVLDDPASVPGEEGPAYPHVYGPVNLDAVTEVLDFEPGPDGRFHLPPSMGRNVGTERG